MRIQTLEVENFMPYRDPVTVDFRDLSLFAIQGETGSGKSSIVDAICYALYGRIPRIRTENGQRENIISHGAKQFHVALTFELGGAEYRIVRQGTAAREDVQVFKDGAQLNQLLKKKDADRYIEEELLRMNFDVFTRIIVLPQGQFDRFLKPDTPRERRDILISLLGLDIYERIGKAAGAHASALQGELAGLERDLAGIDPASVSDEALQELQQKVAAAQDRLSHAQEQLRSDELVLAMTRQRCDKAHQLMAIRTSLASLRGRTDDVALQRERLATGTALASLQPSLASWNRLGSDLARLAEDLAATRAAAQGAEQAFQTARDETVDTSRRTEAANFGAVLDDLAARIARLTELQPYAARLQELGHKQSAAAEKAAQLARSLATAQQTVASGEERLPALRQAVLQARDTLEQAQTALEQAQSDNAAAALQERLKPGDACPVCGHVIDELVPHPVHAGLARLKSTRDSARAALEQCQAELAEHEKRLEAERTRAGELTGQLDALKKEDADDRKEASDLTLRLLMDPTVAREGKDDPAAFLQACLTRLRGSETTTRTAQKALLNQLENLRQKEERARTELIAARTRLASLDGQHTQAEAQYQALEKDLATQAQAHGFASIEAMQAALPSQEELEGLQASVRQYEQEVTKLTAQEQMLRQELGPDLPADDELQRAQATRNASAAAAAQAQDELAEAQQAFGDLTTRRAFLSDRAARREQVTHALATYQQIARDFSSRGMVAYVSGGILEQLLVTANDHLDSLSKGRFELQLAGDQMMVQDAFSAAGPRDVATLSGGETFLASLALALAVKDLLSISVNLDSFFIDEGFGTLDENTVQGVADVLESLRRDGSLIGIITHRADLVERFDTVLEVTNTNGSAHIVPRDRA
mgnify:CR=1 FL=1